MTTSVPHWVRPTRPISWVRAARKNFGCFPQDVQPICLEALTVVAEGGKPDIAKPLHGLGSGVFEISVRNRGNAFRLVYVVQPHPDIWVIHAFQKKSVTGVKTPKREFDVIRQRLQRLGDIL